MTHRVRNTVGVLLFTTTTCLGIAGSAAAGTVGSSYSRAGHSLSNFNPDGEELTTTDRNKDGHSSVTLLRVGSISSNNIEYWNFHGAGTTALADLDLPEGNVVYLKSCEGEWHGSVGASDLLASSCDPTWRRGIA
jgi:hypothetical protein